MSPYTIIILVLGIIIGISGLVAVIVLVTNLSSSDTTYERIQTYADIPTARRRTKRPGRKGSFYRTRVRMNAILSSLGSEALNLQLQSADWDISAAEYIVMRLLATFVGFLLSWLIFRSILSGVGVAVLIYLGFGVYLRYRINRRRKAFAQQLVDALVLIKGAVMAGFSLLQAIEVVSRELQPPVSEEFTRVQQEVSLGVPLATALTNMAARMENPDLDLLVTAIQINYQVGGNLVTMINAVTETIRDRVRLFNEVRVITTQQRYTGYLLTLLPFIIGAILFVMNPEYMKGLFERNIICIPIGALAGILIGNFFIRRVTKIDV